MEGSGTGRSACLQNDNATCSGEICTTGTPGTAAAGGHTGVPATASLPNNVCYVEFCACSAVPNTFETVPRQAEPSGNTPGHRRQPHELRRRPRALVEVDRAGHSRLA